MFKTPEKLTNSPKESPNRNYAYYVVWRGRKPGIYSTWQDCSEQVKGFSNNTYKGFYSYDEARAAFESKCSSSEEEVEEKAEPSSLSPGRLSKHCKTCEVLKLKIKLLETQLKMLLSPQKHANSTSAFSIEDFEELEGLVNQLTLEP